MKQRKGGRSARKFLTNRADRLFPHPQQMTIPKFIQVPSSMTKQNKDRPNIRCSSSSGGTGRSKMESIPQIVFLPSYVAVLIQEECGTKQNRWQGEPQQEGKENSRPPIQPQRSFGNDDEEEEERRQRLPPTQPRRSFDSRDEEQRPPRLPVRSCSPEPGRRTKSDNSVHVNRRRLELSRSSEGLEAAVAA